MERSLQMVSQPTNKYWWRDAAPTYGNKITHFKSIEMKKTQKLPIGETSGFYLT